MDIKNKPFILGIISSFFFSFTFILNRSMSLTGSNFLWSASLRYLFTIPFFIAYLLYTKRLSYIHNVIKRDFITWFKWSFVGFAIFYYFLCLGSDYGSSWLVAASWQFTIVAGVLLTPLFGEKIPKKNLVIAIVILIGVFVIQFDSLSTLDFRSTFSCIIPVIIAAIAYPLGNRKLMVHCPSDINTIERVYGMTIVMLPIWLLGSFTAYKTVGLPSFGQVLQSLMVAIFSAIIATVLFFYATELSRFSQKMLAITESTIAGEVIFTLLGGIVILKDPLPNIFGWVGLVIIIFGMMINALDTKIKNA